jgi:predicted transcriptional regulator
VTPRDLKTLRKKLRISLVELAATVGLPSGYIGQIEEGEVVPLERDLERLEKGLRKLEGELREADDQTTTW